MILYHATTALRGKQILIDNCIKKDIDRFYTTEKNGDGSSTQGYVYLSNEITFSMYFANCHRYVDKSDELYIFQIDIPDELIEADCDELRYQGSSSDEIAQYGGELQCSLLEYKSCRVPFDINFKTYECSYITINIHGRPDPIDLVGGAGDNYKFTINNYTKIQKDFIDGIQWSRL